MKYLHIFNQYTWHDDAYIVGNREGLVALRDAINNYLETKQEEIEVLAGDGEGYDICITEVEDKLIETRLALPYSDEIALGDPEQSIQPWDLVQKYKLKVIK